MSLINKLLHRNKKAISESLFEKAPYLSPWYFNASNPKLTRNGILLQWKWIEKIDGKYVGTLILEGQKNECFGLLKTYTYLLPNSNNDKFIIWSRSNINTNSSDLRISFYETMELQPIEAQKTIILDLKDNKTVFFYFNCKPKSTISFILKPDTEDVGFNFPDEFKDFDDFCVLNEIPMLYKNGDSKWHNTAIILFSPKTNKIYIYPQDWFNKSDRDFGYEWITRTAINPDTGLIHGQGIRIGDFILDKTNREKKR